ncbi:O-methyltransferase [Mycena sp. CBHHK59/15]|nr:O-methyltransferase [Mycena sp. CBHHK59/15]
MSSKSHLRLLGELILKSIDSIESRLASEFTEFPTLFDPFDPAKKVEIILQEEEMLAATSHIVAAASQLVATVRPPAQSVVDNSLAFHLSSCMRAAVESNMVEIIREAGTQGIHADDVAKRNKTDPLKVSRILRLLANHHIFTEISPDVFCSNRLSSVLDSGKSVLELERNPKDRHVNTSGIPALILLHTDESFKGSAYLTEAFTDPATSHSVKPTESPWNIAFETDAFIFDWYDRPENEHRKTRFSLAMAGSIKLDPPAAMLSGFKWNSLPENSVVVDVGGGVGSMALVIAQAVPHIKLVVQDRASVIDDAKYASPDFLTSARVELRGSPRFFQAQPIKNAAAFLLRWILHDWADPLAIHILKHLRDAATPETKLVTVDTIVPYTCCDTSVTESIPGAVIPPAPAPLLPNLGAASNMKYWVDFQMFVLGNCQNRTLGHFVSLATQSGWKVIEVHHIPGSSLGQCISVPI